MFYACNEKLIDSDCLQLDEKLRLMIKDGGNFFAIKARFLDTSKLKQVTGQVFNNDRLFL